MTTTARSGALVLAGALAFTGLTGCDFGRKRGTALQAPFLITDYGLMDAVARSALAGRMLAGLDRYGVVGLALVPGTLLHPSGPRPLVALSSYRRVRFLVVRWRTTGELISALGAK